MRAMEQRDTSFDTSRDVEAQIEGRIRKHLGQQVAFHHTVLSGTVAFGRLHEEIKGAEQAKADLIQNEKTVPYALSYERNRKANVERWEKEPIVELGKGQEYTPFGEGRVLKHGVNDGTHGDDWFENVRV